MKVINTRTTKYTSERIIVDDDVYEIIKDKYIWLGRDKDGTPRNVRVSEKGDPSGKTLSRMIMNPPKGMVVDHISRDVLDNRRSNLRVCTQAENTRNKAIQSNNTSEIPSVRWQKDAKKWRVRIKYLGTKIHIGYFNDKEEAGYVRDQVVLQLHGDYARTYVLRGECL